MSAAFTPGPWHYLDIGEVVSSDPMTGLPDSNDVICAVAGANPIADGSLIASAPELYEALEEIAKGAGPFNRDPLIHAENCIDNMKEIANAALAKARRGTVDA